MLKHNTRALSAFGFVAAGLISTSVTLAAQLTPGAAKAARAATFEVVVLKAEQDPLTYEKPLPMELLPYAIRSDKYLPIGTAFATGANQFVSAGHVFSAMLGSDLGSPALRDQQGRVHEIGQVLKFSMHEDFIVFSLREPPGTKPLKINRSPELSSTVYAVGNALGEGIVVRDGLYTSDTPEEQDGRWKWIRFSAAASPGSSGGPLLDEDGQVIGVVLRRSPNENLNYAVPIGQVLSAPEGLARVDSRGPFRVPIMPVSITSTWKEELKLPLSFADFSSEMSNRMMRHVGNARAELLKVHADSVFPKGADAVQLLNTLYLDRMPRLITKGDDGRWDAEQASGVTTYTLPKNGSLLAGSFPSAGIVRLWAPDDVTLQQLFSDSRLYGDLLLKGLLLTRNMGPEQVKIVSLGPADSESEYTDAWRRKWQVRTWPMAFTDFAVVSLALPLPGGCATLAGLTSSGLKAATIEDLKFLANFVYLSYMGKFQEWEEFLAFKALHPQVFSTFDIAIEYDKAFRFKSRRLELTVPADLQRVTPRSTLALKFTYFLDGDVSTWDLGGIAVTEDDDKRVYMDVLRRTRPPEALPEGYQTQWSKLLERKQPHDRRAWPVPEGGVKIGTALTAGASPARPIDPAAKVIYEVNYAVNVRMDDKSMRSILGTALEGLRILE